MQLQGLGALLDSGAQAFVQAVAGKAPPPIPFDELLEVARVSIDAADFPRTRP